MGLYLGPCVSIQVKKRLFPISWWTVPKPSRPRSYAASPRSSLYSFQKMYLWTPIGISSLGPLRLSCNFLPCLQCLALHTVDCSLPPVVFGIWSWTQKPQISFCWIYQWPTKFLLQMYSHGLEEMIYTLFLFFPPLLRKVWNWVLLRFKLVTLIHQPKQKSGCSLKRILACEFMWHTDRDAF